MDNRAGAIGIGPCRGFDAARFYHALRCERRVECGGQVCGPRPFDEYLKQDNLTAADATAVRPYDAYLAEQNDGRPTAPAGLCSAKPVEHESRPAPAVKGLRLATADDESEPSTGLGGPRIGDVPTTPAAAGVPICSVAAYRVWLEVRGRGLIDVIV